MVIIGDVHGKVNEYKKIIDNTEDNSVQVGDFGFKLEHDWFLNNVDFKKHKILFGNHDYYPYIKYKHSVTKNYTMDFDKSILYIRGAYSIDWNFRNIGYDLFTDEELTIAQFNKIVDNICEWKPKMIISHDCPLFLYEYFFKIMDGRNRTSQALQAIFEVWQPDYWIFGHHHHSKNELIDSTKFICLAELETLII